jgi:hypothetical protein
VVEFFLAERSDSNLAARFADRNQTHDLLQCPSATRRIEPVYRLDATEVIVAAKSSQVERNQGAINAHVGAGAPTRQLSKPRHCCELTVVENDEVRRAR